MPILMWIAMWSCVLGSAAYCGGPRVDSRTDKLDP